MDIERNNLCFDHCLFMKKDFSVDEFLTEHRRIANLEALRDDLGILLKNLRSYTIELINKDYADFVDLSSNLIILEQNINSIQTPMIKIKDEVNNTKIILNEKINKITELMNKKKVIRTKMRNIKSTIKIQTCLERMNMLLKQISNSENEFIDQILIMERVANEINQYTFHSKQCDSLDPRIVTDFNKCSELFSSYLNDIFLSSIKFKKREFLNCLRLYLGLNKVFEAYDLVKNEIVSPVFRKIINEESLHNEPTGLEGLYSKVLSFIDNELKYIIDLTQMQSKDKSVKGFDIMVQSVWPELEERLECNLKSIYSPGDPNTFFKCYTATCTFLDKFEERCTTHKSIMTLRSFNSYKNFLHCWNLPVYYTLRFQELGGRLENIIHSERSTLTNTEDGDWKLLVTKEVWFCLTCCWDEKIFIRQVAHRFWKFNLQTLARYATWMRSIIELKTHTASKINILIYLYTDGCNLSDRVFRIFDIAKERIGSSVSHQILENMRMCLQESKQMLQNTLKNVEENIVALILENNMPIIRQVSGIPRLYRRTNRETPTQPYVSTLLTSVHEFKKVHPSHASKWIPPVLSAITSMYYEQLFEVLTSVQRTEESLRKFKKIRDPLNLDSKNNTDDDKIKLQLYIDIQHYIDTINTLCDSTSNINKFQDLNIILKSLKRNE